MQNLARFRSTSKYGNEYLRNGWEYSQSVSYSFDSDFSYVRQNKFGENWSSDLGDLGVELYPPKTHFLEEYISATKGCWAPKFLEWPSLTSAILPKTGAPLQLFSKKVKIGLECTKWASITSELILLLPWGQRWPQTQLRGVVSL